MKSINKTIPSDFSHILSGIENKIDFIVKTGQSMIRNFDIPQSKRIMQTRVKNRIE